MVCFSEKCSYSRVASSLKSASHMIDPTSTNLLAGNLSETLQKTERAKTWLRAPKSEEAFGTVLPKALQSDFGLRSSAELLHFGIDTMVLNVSSIEAFATESESVANIKKLFKENEENIVIFNQFFRREEILKTPRGIRRVYLYFGRHRVMEIEEIGLDSQLRKFLYYKYDYRITFDGAFFANVRLGNFNFSDVLSSFLTDIRENKILHSISRLDVCADLRGISVLDVRDGIVEPQQITKRQDCSFMSADLKLTIADGLSYRWKYRNQWMARIYNKIIEIKLDGGRRKGKSKEDLYPDYLEGGENDQITRVEIESHQTCSTYGASLPRVIDPSYVLGFFARHLTSGNGSWGVLPIILDQQKTLNILPTEMERRRSISHQSLNLSQKYSRLNRSIDSLAVDFNVSRNDIFKELIAQREDCFWNKFDYIHPGSSSPSSKSAGGIPEKSRSVDFMSEVPSQLPF